MSRLYTIGLELLINQLIVDKLAGATKIKIKEGKKKAENCSNAGDFGGVDAWRLPI